MAAMGGIQLLKAVRADDQLKSTPFILMTGSLDVPNVVAARYAGTDAYLLKPSTQEQLKAKLLESSPKVGNVRNWGTCSLLDQCRARACRAEGE